MSFHSELYQKLALHENTWEHFTQVLGETTEFEAVANIWFAQDEDQWYSYVLFKSANFSPPTHDNHGMKYILWSSMSGSVALTKAINMWEALKTMFSKLLDSTSGHPQRAYSLKLKVGADTKEALQNILTQVLREIDRRDVAAIVSGGSDSGYILDLKHDPSMTHERYFELIDQLILQKKATNKEQE